jgi:hypothetical protein
MASLPKNKPPHKTVGKHVKRQVDEAVEYLQKPRISDEDVHQSRKALKKARASLRLLRPALKDGDYRRVNANLSFRVPSRKRAHVRAVRTAIEKALAGFSINSVSISA